MGLTSIAVAGPRGAGKSAVARELAAETGAFHAKVSSWLRDVLATEGRPATADNLRALGEKVANDPAVLVDQVLEHVGWTLGAPVIFDAIRHVEVLEALRRRLSPHPLLFVFMELEQEQRRERLEARGDATDVLASEHHSTESQIDVLRELADVRLSTGAPLPLLTAQLRQAATLS